MRILALIVLNVFWFGFFMYMIVEHGWSAWSLAVPILIHWNASDFIKS